MRRTISRFSFLSFFLALSCGCGRSTEVAEEEPPPVAPVKAVAPQRLTLGAWTELLGATQTLPGHAARVSAAVEPRVISVLSDGEGKLLAEGQRVDKGDVIVRLDDRIAQSNREKVLASIDELALQKAEAATAVKLAQLDVERLERLAPAGFRRSAIMPWYHVPSG